MERFIQSIDFIESDNIQTVSVGKKFNGTKVADIIEHDGEVMLYNSNDELIALVDLPIFAIKYGYEKELVHAVGV